MARRTHTQGDAETGRLLLVPWTEDYSSDFTRVCQDPEAMRFISGGSPLPDDVIGSILQHTLAMWDEYGYGPWAALDKQTGRWVGRIGLNLLADWPGPDKWEVGYELAPQYWGRGLATEGAREAIRFGWQRTPLTRIISATAAGHRASRRVMEKCGLTFQAEMTFREAQIAWYAIDRPLNPSLQDPVSVTTDGRRPEPGDDR
jgi:RimJ/RimL family protein N-acetyltransferase